MNEGWETPRVDSIVCIQTVQALAYHALPLPVSRRLRSQKAEAEAASAREEVVELQAKLATLAEEHKCGSGRACAARVEE